MGSSNELPTPEDLNRLFESKVVAESRSGYGDTIGFEFDGYKRLTVWQVSIDLVAECYRISSAFPGDERFVLTSQLRRAAVSVTLNIAEGWGRNSKAEFARFSDIARGSLHEVDAAFEIAIRLNYVTREEAAEANSLFRRVGTMLLKLIKTLRSQ